MAELTPTVAVLETNGVGYEINITLIDYAELNGAAGKNVVKLYVHESIREDAHVLFGFLTKKSGIVPSADRRERCRTEYCTSYPVVADR